MDCAEVRAYHYVLAMEFRRVDVEFTSHGATLRGWFYEPERGGLPAPGIVMAHGFSAVKEMFLDQYAAAFAEAGFACLVYDHFGFGASDGEPRQSPAPSLQQEGYRDAIGWLGAHVSVDSQRLAIWGSSYSAGHVIMLCSEDLPIRCAVGQVPDIGPTGPNLSEATLAAVGSAISEGRLDDTIPAASATPEGVGTMFDDGAYDWFTRVASERAPSWRNEVRVGAFTEPFSPKDSLADAKVPLLLIVAPDDRLLPPGTGIATAKTMRNVGVVEIAGGHFDAYEAGFTASSDAAIGWFRQHL
jgi:hypothetical protein